MPLELGRGSGALRVRPLGSARGSLQASDSRAAWCSTASSCCAAPSSAWTTTPSTRSRARCSARARRSPGTHRADEILRLFREDRARFVEYNRKDARLALEVVETPAPRRAVGRAQPLTGLPLDRVSDSIAAFDFLYLRRARPPRHRGAERAGGGVARAAVGRARARAAPRPLPERGGARLSQPVPEPDPQLRDRPPGTGAAETGRPTPTRSWRRTAPRSPAGRASSAACSTRSCPQREAARRAGDAVKSHAIKILMNSFYGVLGTPACRFYDPRLANAITGFGRELLLWCRERIEAQGRRVLYGDTDSLFVESGHRTRPQRAAFGAALATSGSTASWRARRLSLARREPARAGVRPALPAAVPAGDAPRHGGSAQALRGSRAGLRRRQPGRVHGHGGGARRLDRAREGGPARAVRATVRRPAGRGVPARGRRAAAGRAPRRAPRLPQGPAQAARGATRTRRRPTSPPRAGAASGAVASPT